MNPLAPTIERAAPDQAPPQASATGRFSGTLSLALTSSLLLWAALPPLNWAPLAWLAPVPWIVLAERRELRGSRPYLKLWFAGFVFWLATIYWLVLPHWATSFGLVALSFYLALYWPLFVSLLRVAIHRFRWPVIGAAPVIYLGLELARSHVLTGFSMTGLGHSQFRWTTLMQISDLAGASGMGALVVLVAAALARMLPVDGRRLALWPLAVVAVTFAAALGYGHWRLGQDATRPGPKVALIQGSIDITMKMDEGAREQIFEQYSELTRQALAKESKLDLIVWPETMFRYPWFTFAPDFELPAGAKWSKQDMQATSRDWIEGVTGPFGVPILLGIDTVHDGGQKHYNSALFVDKTQQVGPRYDKAHRVMFGEYVPLAEWFPWLYRLTPLPGGLNAGSGPVVIETGGVRYAPDICFESTLSHFIRNQVTTLSAEGHEPDVLLNLTNDGWFWGSSELEQHLSCGVFRAIECRKPLLIAANTGISAWIDSEGRVRAEGPKRATDVILADARLDNRRSPYLVIGDWPAGICLALCVGLAVAGWRGRRRSQ